MKFENMSKKNINNNKNKAGTNREFLKSFRREQKQILMR